ncbi:MAG TPA: hypothetical protein VNH11_27575 [Pirellulales bacterium]|nr:hypothetical protein [Pirellulales bacterium]
MPLTTALCQSCWQPFSCYLDGSEAVCRCPHCDALTRVVPFAGQAAPVAPPEPAAPRSANPWPRPGADGVWGETVRTMRRGCLITAGLLFCALIGSTWLALRPRTEPQPGAPFYVTNRFGERQIVVVAPRGDTDELAAVKVAIKHLDRGKFCWLLFWRQADRLLVPTEMPMRDEQADAMLGSYLRNDRTGFQRLLLHGREIPLD